MKKTLLLLGIVLFFSLGVWGANVQSPSLNAIWLNPQKCIDWLYYEVRARDTSFVVDLSLPQNAEIYLGKLHTEYHWLQGKVETTDIRKLDQSQFWLTYYQKNYPYQFIASWISLTKQDDKTVKLADLLNQPIYIRIEEKNLWYIIQLSDKLHELQGIFPMIVPMRGLLEVGVYTENLTCPIW